MNPDFFKALLKDFCHNQDFWRLALIYFASKSVSEIQAQLTGVHTDVLSCLHANFFILNLEKTKIMLVGTYQRTAEADDLVIEISNTRLERVNKFKYIGVLPDNTLS